MDRQWLIPDARLMHAESPPLWAARRPGQVFVVEQHAQPIDSGPGLLFSGLVPDMDHFKGSEGGRTLPLLHPSGDPNVAPGLLSALPCPATATDLLSYVAAVVAHPDYTRRFADELVTPGIRVPLTADPGIWADAVALGADVLWAHTYGEAATSELRSRGSVRFPSGAPVNR